MELEDLRLAAYRSFAETGRAPSTAMLAEQLETNSAEINSGLEVLAHNRHVVLNRDDDIVMAHPFSAVPLGYAVMGSTTLWARQHCGLDNTVVGWLRMGLLRAASACARS